MNPRHNDWYEELCALACIGELSSSEFEDLQAHLVDCASCRQLHADFRRISANDLACVVVSTDSSQMIATESEGMDEKLMLDRLLDRARQQRCEAIPAPKTRTVNEPLPLWRLTKRIIFWLRQPALSYGTVALLLCAVTSVAAYRLREAQLSPALLRLHLEADDLKNKVSEKMAEAEETSVLLARSQAERDALRKSLIAAEARYTAVKSEKEALNTALASERKQIIQGDDAVELARADVDEKRKEIAALEARLRSAVDRTERERQLAQTLQARLDDLQEQMPSTPEAQGFGDLEAKQLFGARDLHIVDVYDVDAKGVTKRTYGRVYYVEKKLLMLYAFDLENKKHNRTPASFQAWGYRQPDAAKPESLGLFSVDDASANRWVLKVNNPRVLERIDAVFVTAEAPSGSPSPTGRRILYANLAGPANHP